MSEMPVFDDIAPETSAPAEQPPKRKPRKPMKRQARAVPGAPKHRVAKKRGRGRPPGAPNKPKPGILVQESNNVAAIIGTHAQIQHLLSKLTPAERKAMIDCLK